VSGRLARLATAGPDGVRDPVPNPKQTSDLKGRDTGLVLWIVGSSDRHLIQLFHPGINARFSWLPAASADCHSRRRGPCQSGYLVVQSGRNHVAVRSPEARRDRDHISPATLRRWRCRASSPARLPARRHTSACNSPHSGQNDDQARWTIAARFPLLPTRSSP
jgi:hypothetical protein